MASSPTALPKPQAGQPCPCGSGQPFDACCGPLLSGARKPASAEELMRSRFTAHVARDYAYLHRTYQPTWKQPYTPDANAWSEDWTRLEIHAHEPGANPDTAYVDFTAFFVRQQVEYAHQEKSEFHRVDGQWLFTRTTREGPAPIKSSAPKVGRNDPCPCGSGKKYKHCCLLKQA
jgi:SEC-C motif-containing protein